MNSWSKHIPKAVGALGAIFLLYSMYTFFRRPEIPPQTVMKPHTPPQSGGLLPTKKPVDKYVGKTWDKNAASAFAASERDRVAREEKAKREERAALEAKMVMAKAYLSDSNLKMHLPEDADYSEARNEGMRMLIASKNGKPEMYVVSGKQKMTPDQARAEMEDQMFGEFGLSNIKQETVNSPNLGKATQFKGVTKDGQEFQAMFFYNARSGNSHMVFMVDTDLSRQPARTRQVFDSLDYGR